jgi:ATP-dependent Lhr-like helicase
VNPLPFHAETARWFAERYGAPTDVQERAWPVIAAGGHVLVTAPTGTGKTLAAFLGAIDRLLTGAWPAGALRVLYVSPLKALNTDVARNLVEPLEALTARFLEAKLDAPSVEVMVRSGDTPEDERRRLKKRPPEILITTPESLNILLTQKGAAAMFAGLRAVIVDEIHAVAGSKRGTALLTALERLTLSAGEFQRIGLSATVNPPDLTARVLGGFEEPGLPRSVTLVASPASKAYDVQIVVPAARPFPEPDSGKIYWESLALDLRRRVQDRRSTLIFTNSRRSCEKLARLINEDHELLAYSHHGSLAKDIRRDVEQRLKAGELRALVATNSLELGIDIGDLDEVVLAQTPRTIASAIQKTGRAGHRTGEVSRARLYPSHGLDVIEAAVIARCIRGQQVEPLVIPEGPLDVLAQVLLSQLCARESTADELYSLVVKSWPYRNLSRHAFDLVLEMLAGRYAGTRIGELRPRIEQTARGLWTAKDSTPFLIYRSGGTIPDRGYFTMRDPSGTAIGELDEEFVWERTEGERFALGAQVWKIVSITDQAVTVEPSGEPPHIIPFWSAEDQDRAWFLAEKIGSFLEEADRALAHGIDAWRDGLVRGEGFSAEAADMLVSTLTRQKEACGALPHRWRAVVERVEQREPGADAGTVAQQYVVHTFWGARINRPWAYALAQAWEDRYGYALETYPGDDQILVLIPPEAGIDEVLALVTPDNLEALLRRRVEATGYFGARFREGAGRSLLLPRAGFDKRTPLWQTRMKAKRLFEAVSEFPEFPVLVEAWRQCLRDEFDLDGLKARLDERASGQMATWYCTTPQPSPFTEGLLWRQVNEKMYATDEPPARRRSTADDKLWDELLASERPRLPRAAVTDWEARWGRTEPGYSPETPADLADLLEVRIALSEAEWEALIGACARDSRRADDEWRSSVAVEYRNGRVGVPALAALWSDPEPLWLRWLEGRGPVGTTAMAVFWGVEPQVVNDWVVRQREAGTIVDGLLTEDAVGPEVCLARTWEQLVRRLRRERRGAVTAKPAAGLPLFLAQRHGLTHPDKPAALEEIVGRLLGLPLPAELWEAAVLPARLVPYRPSEFDRLFTEGGLRWFGAGSETVVLGFPEDRAAFVVPDPEAETRASELFASASELPVTDLAQGTPLPELTKTLWDLAWKGAASAIGFGPLRQGIRSHFKFELSDTKGHRDRGGFQRWSSARSSGGTWRRWPASVPLSPVERAEDAKRRARLVLDRYGIVFRTLLAREGTAFQWKELFPAFRLMELSGEIAGGVFWEGVPGLQFATPEALRDLETVSGDTIWIHHAQDPVSLCGLGLDAFSSLPKRVQGSWLWWCGQELVGVVSSSGKKLDLLAADADLALLVRRTVPLLLPEGRAQWTLETVDGVPAPEHQRTPELLAAGFRGHGDKLIYWRT